MAAIPVGSHPCAGRAILRRVSPVAQLEFMIPIVRKRSVDAAAACGGSRDNVDCAPSRSRVLAAGQARVGAERRASSQARVEQAGGRRYLSGAEERFQLDRERDHTPSLEKIEREREATLAAKMWISNFRKVLGVALHVYTHKRITGRIRLRSRSVIHTRLHLVHIAPSLCVRE